MNPEQLVSDMQRFFEKEHPEFILFIPEPDSRKSVSFYAKYPKANASIVVYPSIKIENGKMVFRTGKLSVMIFNLKTRSMLFELKKTYRKNWKKGISDKVKALKILIDDIKPCEKCGTIPNIQRNFSRKDGKGTKFVSLYCEQCKRYKSTTYGIYLKTFLHKHLK